MKRRNHHQSSIFVLMWWNELKAPSWNELKAQREREEKRREEINILIESERNVHQGRLYVCVCVCVCVSCISIRKFSPRAFILVFSSLLIAVILQMYASCVCSGYAVNRNAVFRLWKERQLADTNGEGRAWHYAISSHICTAYTAFVRVSKKEEKMYSQSHKHMGNTHPYMRTTNVLGKLFVCMATIMLWHTLA